VNDATLTLQESGRINHRRGRLSVSFATFVGLDWGSCTTATAGFGRTAGSSSLGCTASSTLGIATLGASTLVASEDAIQQGQTTAATSAL
jgi:hypothetical protein